MDINLNGDPSLGEARFQANTDPGVLVRNPDLFAADLRTFEGPSYLALPLQEALRRSYP